MTSAESHVRPARRRLTEHTSRRGVTVSEVLVVIGVISLLMALVLPALQSSRAAARTTQCASNLKGLGVALIGYEGARGALPVGLNWRIMLLPHLGQSAIYDSLARVPPEEAMKVFPGVCERDFGTVVIPAYLCPADAESPLQSSPHGGSTYATANYAACYASFPLLVDGRDGAFGGDLLKPRDIPLAAITDGLSNTAALSEMLRSNGKLTRLRPVWFMPKDYSSVEAEAFATDCEAIPSNAEELGWIANSMQKGFPWCSSDHAVGLYNHALGPNRPSCKVSALWSGIYSASSAHSGGVNVLFVDGHVRFQNESVDLKVWRELASRSHVPM